MPKLKIRRIALRNFGSFDRASLDFSSLRYPVIVLGDNGAGKTVFFVDGVTYAFFGDAYGSGRVSRKSVSRFHSGGDVSTSIVLESDDGAIFEVVNKKVYKLSPQIQYPGIGDLTGHRYDTLLSTYIVRQGRVSDFIEGTPSERRNLLLRLLEHRFDKANDLVRDELDKIREEMESINNELNRIEGRFKAHGISEITDEALNTELERLNVKKDELKGKLEDLKKKHELIKRDIEVLRERLGELNTTLKIINKVKDLSREIKGLEDEVSQLYIYPDRIDESKLEILRSKIDDLSRNITYRNKLSEYSSELREVLKRYEEEFIEIDFSPLQRLRERLDSHREEKGRLSSEVNVYRERIDKLSDEVSECPLCGAPLDAKHRLEILEVARKKIEELESRSRVVDEEISRFEEEIRRLEAITHNFEGFLGGVERLVNVISKELDIYVPKVAHENVYTILSNLSGHINREYEGVIENTENIFKVLQDMGFRIDIVEIEDLEVGLRDFERRIREIYIKLRELRRSYREYMEEIGDKDEEHVIEELKDCNRRIEELKEESENVGLEWEDKFKKLNEVSLRIEELTKLRDILRDYIDYKNRLESLEEEYDLHNDLKDIFSKGGFQLYYLENIFIPELNDLMDKYLSEFNSDYRVKFEVSADKLEMYIYQGSHIREIRSLSGGELTLLGLAFRLAFGELISKSVMNYTFDFLILDEALTHLDEENKKCVVERLVELVNKGLLSQIIIITHDRTIQEVPELTGSTIHIYREDSTSRIEISR